MGKNLSIDEMVSRLEEQQRQITELQKALQSKTEGQVQSKDLNGENWKIFLAPIDHSAIVLDLEGTIIAANTLAEKALADSQLIGKKAYQIFRRARDRAVTCIPQDNPSVVESFQGFWIVDTGGMFDTVCCVSVVYDGKQSGILILINGISKDIQLQNIVNYGACIGTNDNPVFFCRFSKDGKFLDYFILELEEYNFQSQIRLGISVDQVFPPTESISFLNIIGQVFKTGKSQAVEYQFARSEGNGKVEARFFASNSDWVYGLFITRKKMDIKSKFSFGNQFVLDSSVNSFVVLDQNGLVLYDDPSDLLFLGYPVGKLVGTSIFELVEPEEEEKARILLNRILQVGGVLTTRCRLLMADGNWRWVEVTGINLLDMSGSPGIVANCRDIDQRIITEEALLRRNRELELLNRAIRHFISTLELDQVLALTLDGIRRLLQVTACSVWLLDQDTRELFCRQVTDPAAPLIRGWRLEPGQGLAGWVAEHGKSLNVPDVQIDNRHYKGVDEKTGLPLRSILSVPLINKGVVVGVIQAVDTEVERFTAEDQSIIESLAAAAAGAIENARLYKELNASQQYTRNVIDSSLDMIITVDLNRRIVEFNKAAQEAFGYQPEEIIGQNVELLYSNAEQALYIHEMTVINGHCVQRIDNRRKNGEVFPVHLSASTLRDASGRLVGVMGISRDISAQVMAEEKIRASLEEKEVLLREIHHRVKNNLQIISSMLKLQSRSVQDQHLADMLRDSQSRIRSMALIHETLYQSPDLSKVNLKAYIHTLASHLCQMYSFQERGIHLSVLGNEMTMDIDTAVPCGLIVTELLTNAFTHGFPIPISSGQPQKLGEIIVYLEQKGDNFVLQVKDNGMGLAPDFNIENSESLGFRLVNALTKQLNGTITIDRNHGTAITISFTRMAYL